MLSRDGPAPQSIGTITETETEAAVGLAARVLNVVYRFLV